MKKPKQTTGWAGFVDGRIDRHIELDSLAPILCIYPNKSLADRHYEEVRKVEIREVRK